MNQVLSHLAVQVRSLETRRRSVYAPKRIATGVADFDRILSGGFEPGQLVEWIGGVGNSVISMTLLLLRAYLQSNRGPFFWFDPDRTCSPSVLAGLGIDLRQVIVVRPDNERDTLWAYEQVLRSQGVAGSICMLNQLHPMSFRRLQLASEVGNGIHFLVRPMHMLNQPTWANCRFLVTSHRCQLANSPAPASRATAFEAEEHPASAQSKVDSPSHDEAWFDRRLMRVMLIKARQLRPATVDLELHDDQENGLHLVPATVRTTPSVRDRFA